MISWSGKKRFLLEFAGLLAVFIALSSCDDSRGPSSKRRESLRIGMESTAVNSLIYIAADQGFFAANGLDLSFKEYASGLAATDAMLKGDVDLATAAEFVIVGKALAKERICALASIDKFRHIYLIGRRDLGIETLRDLKGKRIGLPLKTAAEFYLGRFLDLQGMNLDMVTPVNVAPPQSVEALAAGEVDAVVAWRPMVNAIEDRLGKGIVKWPVQSNQAAYCAVLAEETWVLKNREPVNRFLKSLAGAEDYLAHQPDESRSIVQRKARYDDAYMRTVWPEHQVALSLDRSIILAMEDEARWMIRNGLTAEKEVPKFQDYIDEAGLKAIKPEAVNVIR